jgi:hypothetical protein
MLSRSSTRFGGVRRQRRCRIILDCATPEHTIPVFPIVSPDDLRKGPLQRPDADGIIYMSLMRVRYDQQVWIWGIGE